MPYRDQHADVLDESGDVGEHDRLDLLLPVEPDRPGIDGHHDRDPKYSLPTNGGRLADYDWFSLSAGARPYFDAVLYQFARDLPLADWLGHGRFGDQADFDGRHSLVQFRQRADKRGRHGIQFRRMGSLGAVGNRVLYPRASGGLQGDCRRRHGHWSGIDGCSRRSVLHGLPRRPRCGERRHERRIRISAKQRAK